MKQLRNLSNIEYSDNWGIYCPESPRDISGKLVVKSTKISILKLTFIMFIYAFQLIVSLKNGNV